MSTRQRGFTLLEVLLILVILSMLLVLASPAFKTTLNTVSRSGVETDIMRFEEAIKIFYLDMRRHPQTIEELWQQPANEPRWHGPYLNPQNLVWPPENYALDNRGKVYWLELETPIWRYSAGGKS